MNFQYIQNYIEQGALKNFKKLFENYGYSETSSEDKYELLEPWIQWVTVSTGLKYDEHKIFRLGDITQRQDLNQIFEKIEAKGYTVGAVSPFNADNRLMNAAFFAPDPWTDTKATGSKEFVGLSDAVSQAVNDNASGKLSIKSLKALITGIVKYTKPSDYGWYSKNLVKLKSQTGTKAMILDKLLADTFLYQWKKTKPDFSNLFLNTGAHFQHHYMFNSKVYKGDFKNPEWYCSSDQDPLLNILKLYDTVLGKLMKLPVRLIIATALHQNPHEKLTFYWRLKNHEDFLKAVNISYYKKVLPRMSRDFLVEFESEADAIKAQGTLEEYMSDRDNNKIFTIDNRGKSLFVELTYPNDIDDNFSISGKEQISNFKQFVAFVAIKNGEHDGIGYVVDTENRIPKERFPLSNLHGYLLEDYV